MSTLLLLVIYIIFIGLGIPDSVFGAAWPAIYAELGLPVSRANFITLTVSGGTILSSLLSARLICRWGTGLVTAVSTAMTAAALLGFSCSDSFLFLWLMAIPLGIGAGAIDTALNNYAALHYKASHMSFLHCFYGVGVACSPLLMSLSLAGSSDWRCGYRAIFYIQLAITLLSFAALPLWSRAVPDGRSGENTAGGQLLPLLRLPKLYMTGLVFAGSCALEYTCANWGSTFLVGAKGFSADRAAGIITFYYVGLTLGRFLSGILAAKVSGRRLILAGQGIIALAVLLLLLPLPPAISGAAFLLLGLGEGPVVPNMLYLTPANFGKALSQSVMSLQMVFSYIGTLCAPVLFGIAAQSVGVALFPHYLLILYVITLSGTLMLYLHRRGA